MAKGKTPQVKTALRGPKFYAFNGPAGSIAPTVREELLTMDDWVHHGRNNLFPEAVLSLVDNCAPLQSCVSLGQQFIAGHGIRFYDKQGEEIAEAQAKFQEWMGDSSEEQFLHRVSYDLAHGLGIGMQVRRSAAGDIVRIDHIDRFGLRSGKMKNAKVNGLDTRKVMEYYWSPDWCQYMKTQADDIYKPTPIPVFEFGKDANKHLRSVIFKYDYRPREPYYGRVFWLGAYIAAETWSRIDLYNRTQIDTGFAPKIIMGTRFEGSDAQQAKYQEDFETMFQGSTGTGLFHFLMNVGEDNPFVHEMGESSHAGQLDEIRQASAEVIYDAYGIPSLLLHDREAGLTSQERAIAMRLQQFQRTFVEPKQKMITQPIVQLLGEAGIDVWEAKIQPLNIFDPVQSEAVIMASTTVDEARVQRGQKELDDKELGAKLLVEVKPVATPAAPVDPNADPNMPNKPTPPKK